MQLGTHLDNIRILCLIYTKHRIGILCYMYTVHGTDNIRILCTMDCVVFPLSSSLFLKAHNHGMHILLLLSDWMKTGYMLQPLGDAQSMTPTGQQMMIPNWLTLLSWSLVSRTVQCTQCFWQKLGKKGGWGTWKLKNFDPVGRHYPNVVSLRIPTCNHS